MKTDNGATHAQHSAAVLLDEFFERRFGHIRQTRQAASA